LSDDARKKKSGAICFTGCSFFYSVSSEKSETLLDEELVGELRELGSLDALFSTMSGFTESLNSSILKTLVLQISEKSIVIVRRVTSSSLSSAT
jgi:hypothetical protein